MKVNSLATKEEVFNAPIMNWADSYCPIPNAEIINAIENNIRQSGLQLKNEHFKVARTESGAIKGVIGGYDLFNGDENLGQRLLFRNSYDKTMSFAFTCGSCVFICENGVVSGDYTNKRVHKGTAFDDAMASINDGFEYMDGVFKKHKEQLGNLNEIRVDKELAYKLIGDLFFEQGVLSITQMSIVKREFEFSKNFKHLGDDNFMAYDLYNHITESLKKSSVQSIISDHISTHKLFEQTFNI